ncbi:unnamed protein product, partial [Nesidiocoris tenuis]
MSSPWPTLAICLSYAYFSKRLGPALMANRKPLKLNNVLVFYNLFQTLFSAWIFYEGTKPVCILMQPEEPVQIPGIGRLLVPDPTVNYG